MWVEVKLYIPNLECTIFCLKFCYVIFSVIFFFHFFFWGGDIPRHSSCRYSIDYFCTSFEKEKKIDLLYCIALKMFDNSLLLQISQVFLSNLNNALKFNVCIKCKDKTPSPRIDILQGFLFSCFCYIFSLFLWISLDYVSLQISFHRHPLIVVRVIDRGKKAPKPSSLMLVKIWGE